MGLRAAGNLRRHLSPGRIARRGLNLALSGVAGACCYGQPGILRKCGIGRRQPAQQERSPAIGLNAPGVSAFRAQLHTRPILRRPARVLLFRVRFVSRSTSREDITPARSPRNARARPVAVLLDTVETLLLRFQSNAAQMASLPAASPRRSGRSAIFSTDSATRSRSKDSAGRW